MKYILLFFFVISANANEIDLPNRNYTDNGTLLGVDSNQNNVRDDIELFNYDNISKKYEIYTAYLKFAESKQNIQRFYPDVKKVKENEKLVLRDSDCIVYFNQIGEKIPFHIESKIIDLLYNNEKRKAVARWYNKNSYQISAPSKIPTKPFEKNVCRFSF